MRRHPAIAALTAAVIVSVVVCFALIVSWWGEAERANRQSLFVRRSTRHLGKLEPEAASFPGCGLDAGPATMGLRDPLHRCEPASDRIERVGSAGGSDLLER